MNNLNAVVILEKPQWVGGAVVGAQYYAWCKRCNRHVRQQAWASRALAERAATEHLQMHARSTDAMADQIVRDQLRIVGTVHAAEGNANDGQ